MKVYMKDICAVCNGDIERLAIGAEWTHRYPLLDQDHPAALIAPHSNKPPMKRIIRDRHLTPEEIARHNIVCDQVAKDLPERIERHHERTEGRSIGDYSKTVERSIDQSPICPRDPAITRAEVGEATLGPKQGFAFSIYWEDRKYPNLIGPLYSSRNKAGIALRRYLDTGEYETYGDAE